MKKRQKILLFSLLIVLICVFSVSCKNDSQDYTAIETPNLKYENGAYIVNLSSKIKKIDLTSYFSVSNEATFEVSTTDDFSVLVGDEIELNDGENKLFVKVKAKDKETVYKFLFIRKKTCNVIFKIDGETDIIGSIQCEEGTVVESPSYKRQGYNITWGFDFDKEITADTTIIGTLTPIKYKITISAPGLDIDGSSYTVDYGSNIVVPNPERVGYEFKGWTYNDAAYDISKPYNIANDITIVPTFKKLEYKITYNINGGLNVDANPNYYTVDDKVVFAEPTWVNETFIFDGWYLDSSFETSISEIKAGTTGDITVYAKWTKVDIPEIPAITITNVTIVADGYPCDGTTEEFILGESYELPELQRNGYKCVWTINGESIPTVGIWAFSDADITIMASWSLVEYKVFYELDNGKNNTGNPETFTIESDIKLEDPTKEYAVFKGWYTDPEFLNKIEKINQFSADLKLYALWEYKEVTVTYNPNSGEIAEKSQVLIYGNNYNLIVPSKSGYEFMGWYLDDDSIVEINGQWLYEENIALTAKWQPKKYKIEYELNGGNEGISSFKKEYTVEDENYTLPNPVKAGQIFLGWSTETSETVKSHITIVKGMNTGDLKFIANWCDEKDENGFLFNVSADGTASLMGYNGEIGNLTIPSEHNGYKVTSIANSAFYGFGEKISGNSSNSFTTVYIPSTVVRIGAYAFANCDDLKVQYLENDEVSLEEWLEDLVIEGGNDYVLDVINSKRPAIGWYKYVK